MKSQSLSWARGGCAAGDAAQMNHQAFTCSFTSSNSFKLRRFFCSHMSLWSFSFTTKGMMVLLLVVSDTLCPLTRHLLLSNNVRNLIVGRERRRKGLRLRRNDGNFLFKYQTCFLYQLWMKIAVGFCSIDWRRGWRMKYSGKDVRFLQSCSHMIDSYHWDLEG